MQYAILIYKTIKSNPDFNRVLNRLLSDITRLWVTCIVDPIKATHQKGPEGRPGGPEGRPGRPEGRPGRPEGRPGRPDGDKRPPTSKSSSVTTTEETLVQLINFTTDLQRDFGELSIQNIQLTNHVKELKHIQSLAIPPIVTEGIREISQEVQALKKLTHKVTSNNDPAKTDELQSELEQMTNRLGQKITSFQTEHLHEKSTLHKGIIQHMSPETIERCVSDMSKINEQ